MALPVNPLRTATICFRTYYLVWGTVWFVHIYGGQ